MEGASSSAAAALELRFVTVEERQRKWRSEYTRVSLLSAEEIEASIRSALQGQGHRRVHIDTTEISFSSLYHSLLHVRDTLEQLRLDVSGPVPWSFLCKVVASCPKLKSLQLSCDKLVGQFPCDLELPNLVYLSVRPGHRVPTPIGSVDAVLALLKSARSLETLILDGICFSEEKQVRLRGADPPLELVIKSESLKCLILQSGAGFLFKLQTPNLEAFRGTGYGKFKVVSSVDKLTRLEGELDVEGALPSLKTLVIHVTNYYYQRREALPGCILNNVSNVHTLIGHQELLPKLSEPLTSLRVLGIEHYQGTPINKDDFNSCPSLEKLVLDCGGCHELIEIDFRSKPATFTEICSTCAALYSLPSHQRKQSLKFSSLVLSLVFPEMDYESWPAISSDGTSDAACDQDLSKISEDDWPCNMYKVDISRVKQSAKSLVAPFFYTGCLSEQQSVSTLLYWQRDSAPSKLVLPAKDEDIEKLLQHCSDALFGQDDKDVYDPTYRKSLKLDPGNFATSFYPCNYDIVEALRKVFCTPLRVELHKLNVYRPGDFFKAHRDTPRDGLVGSLVVVLPGNHTGGELLVRHRGVEHCLSIQESSKIHWAAFYSDCEHEVKQLESGYRLTLTYNLYREQPSPPSAQLFDVTSLPIYNELKSLKRLRGTKKVLMGVACQYSYPFNKGEVEKTSEQMVDMLKGEDAMMFAAAQAAGLKPVLVQVWSCESETPGKVFTTPTLTKETFSSANNGEKFAKIVPAFEPENNRDIVWLNREDLEYQMCGSVLRYGNEPSVATVYRAVAILMYINLQDGDEDDVRKDAKKIKTRDIEEGDEVYYSQAELDEMDEEDEGY